MKKILKLIVAWFLDISGMNALYRLLNRNKAVILLYHGVCDDDFDLLKGYDERHISKSVFKEHLDYIKRKGYVFVSMTELVSAIKNKEKIDRYVVLTFDDGFQNVVKNAYPIMKEYGAKGCFYLVSNLVGRDKLLWTDRVETVIRNQKKGDFIFNLKGEEIEYNLDDTKSYECAMEDIKAKLRRISDRERHEHMKQFNNLHKYAIPKEFIIAGWEQIKEIDSGILEIGCHTKKHPNCTNLESNEEFEDEILNSKIDIEKNSGQKVKHFCYPAGAYNNRVIEKVVEYGYESAVTTIPDLIDHSSNLYELSRIEAKTQLLFLKANLSGSSKIIPWKTMF